MDKWTTEEKMVWLLYRNGQVITDEWGQPKFYLSREEAEHIAANWDAFRMPLYAELKAMTDEELVERATRIEKPNG